MISCAQRRFFTLLSRNRRNTRYVTKEYDPNVPSAHRFMRLYDGVQGRTLVVGFAWHRDFSARAPAYPMNHQARLASPDQPFAYLTRPRRCTIIFQGPCISSDEVELILGF